MIQKWLVNPSTCRKTSRLISPSEYSFPDFFYFPVHVALYSYLWRCCCFQCYSIHVGFNSDGRHLCDFQDLFLMEQHMSQVESPIHDPSGFYLSPLLPCNAKRHCSYSWKRNITCCLWKIHDISNTQPAFVETNSYWGSFSQVQSIFILWLSKHLLQVTGWLGELLQIVVSHSPCDDTSYIKYSAWQYQEFEEKCRCRV